MTFGQWLAVAILSFLLGLVISIGNNWRYQVPRGRRYHLAFASLMVVVCVPVCLLIDTCQTMFSLSIPTRRFAWGFYVQWRQIQPVGAIQWAAYGAFHALMAVPLGLLPFLLPALRSPRRALAASLALSTLVELSVLLVPISVSPYNIVLSWVGCLAGCGLYHLFRWLHRQPWYAKIIQPPPR